MSLHNWNQRVATLWTGSGVLLVGIAKYGRRYCRGPLMESTRKRTVLVVGAGLSIPAGLPSQRHPLKEMCDHPSGFASEGAISYQVASGSPHDDTIPTIGVSYYEGIQRARNFIEHVFVPIVEGRPWYEVSIGMCTLSLTGPSGKETPCLPTAQKS